MSLNLYKGIVNIKGGKILVGGQQTVITPPSGTVSFTLDVQPYSDTEYIQPLRGMEHWINTPWNDGVGGAPTTTFKNPVTGIVTSSSTHNYDKYVRFDWNNLDNGVSGSNYTFTPILNGIQTAASWGGKFNFSIMMAYDSHDIIPQWFINTGNTQYFSSGSITCPKWNSTTYLNALNDLLTNIYTYLTTNYYNGILLHDYIGYIDIRGYGNFGEWHCYGSGPYKDQQDAAGYTPDAAGFKAIIDANLNAFPTIRQVIPVAATHICGYCDGYVDSAGYTLLASNSVGRIGIRIDHLGDDLSGDFVDKGGTYVTGGVSYDIDTLRANQWKYAPFVGEPNSALSDFSGFETAISQYHWTSFGNGNFWGKDTGADPFKSYILAAGKKAGYRVSITGGSVSPSITNGVPFYIITNWQNTGVAPVYENWNIQFELRNGSNSVVWTGNSTKNLKLYLPENNLPETTAHSWTDTFTLNGISAGTYSLNIIIKDPAGYRTPFILNNYNRTSYGGYVLKSDISIS